MAYPTSPTDGQKVGANLCPRPQFSDALNAGNWVGQNAVAAYGGANCLKMGPQPTNIVTITLPGVPVTPATFKISVRANTVNTGLAVGVRPVGSSRVTGGTGVAKAGTANVLEWKPTCTDSIVAGDTGTAVELYIKPLTASGSYAYLANIRIDYSDSLAGDTNWYLDGATPDTANYDYSWDGTALYSQSSANYINVDATPPSVPTGLTVTGTTASSISLSWSPSTDNVAVTGYNVYDGTTKVNSSPITATTYVHTGLAETSVHTYKVTALDAKGNESAKSSQVAGTVGYTPHRPYHPIQVGATSHSITMEWRPGSVPGGGSSSADYDPNITGYNVWEGATKVNTAPVPAAPLPTHTRYTVEGLLPNTAHTYTVTSLDAHGNESTQSVIIAPMSTRGPVAPPHTGYPTTPSVFGEIIGRNYCTEPDFINPRGVSGVLDSSAPDDVWVTYNGPPDGHHQPELDRQGYKYSLWPGGGWWPGRWHASALPFFLPADIPSWPWWWRWSDNHDSDEGTDWWVYPAPPTASSTIYINVLDSLPCRSGTYKIWLYYTAVGTQARAGLRPRGSTSVVSSPNIPQTAGSSDQQWVVITQTVTVANDDDEVLELYIDTGDGSNTHAYLIRVDFADSPVLDYFSGSIGNTDTTKGSLGLGLGKAQPTETSDGHVYDWDSDGFWYSERPPWIATSTARYNPDVVEPAEIPYATLDSPTSPEVPYFERTPASLMIRWTAPNVVQPPGYPTATGAVAVLPPEGYNVYAVGRTTGTFDIQGNPVYYLTKLNTAPITDTFYVATKGDKGQQNNAAAPLEPGSDYVYAIKTMRSTTTVAPAGESYRVYVSGTTLDGAPVPDTEPPTTPGDLVVSTATPTTIKLQWSPSTDNIGVVGYDVYEGPVRIANAVAQNTYTATGLTPETAHSYTVVARDAAGNESPAAGPVTGTTMVLPPPDTIAPTAPASVTVVGVTNTTITVQWTPSTDNVGVTGYDVYRQSDGVKLGSRTTTSFTATGLAPTTDYGFYVVARDAAGNYSPASPMVTGTTGETPITLPPPSGSGGGSGGGPITPPPASVDESDPWGNHAALATALAPRVAAFVGRAGDAKTTAAATEYVPVVTEYVRGYTRGRGFNAYVPAGPLQTVIVAAAARLVANPDQVTAYQTGDYSERPATLTGWTLPELAILHRYRKLAA